jgi:Ca2+-binding EF-hand superfamily protein
MTVEGEYEELRAAFEASDTNGNGTLQFGEFVDLLDNLGADMSEREYRIGFDAIDVDRDGRINCEEFLGWWLDR